MQFRSCLRYLIGLSATLALPILSKMTEFLGLAQLGTFPSVAGGGKSEEKGVAATWRVASEPRERRQRLSCNRKRKRTTAFY